MSDTTPVRTTMQPGEVIHVGPAELLDLQRQGLLLPDPAEEQRTAATTKKKEV